ncbi:hypothetical protein PQX77_018585 [Marasmius sp. AFHP31]|nr:hypothetical protein PQX77_018585 [Marasmius sp. AFHP31]
MAATNRPTPPLIQTQSCAPSSNGDSKSEEAEEDVGFSDEDEQEVDELESDASEGAESVEEEYRPGDGRRKPGDPLLPAVRVENILNADGVIGNLPLSKEAMFILQASTEEFVKRLMQGGHRQASAESRNNVTYHDMANTARQYQEFMFLTADALELRKERSRLMFAEDEAPISNPTRPKPQPNRNNPTQDHNEQPPSSSKTKPRTNGKEQTNGFVHTTVQPSAPNGPAHGTPSVLDARPWTHWSEPISFQTNRTTPAAQNGHTSTTSRSRSSESTEKEKDSPQPPPGQLAGPASGFIQPRGSSSLSSGNQNTGRTIYSQQP